MTNFSDFEQKTFGDLHWTPVTPLTPLPILTRRVTGVIGVQCFLLLRESQEREKEKEKYKSREGNRIYVDTADTADTETKNGIAARNF
jgi:hypothetical protein